MQKDNHSGRSEEIEPEQPITDLLQPEQPGVNDIGSKTSTQKFPIDFSSLPFVPSVDLAAALPVVPVKESETNEAQRAKPSDVTSEIIDTSSSALTNTVQANEVSGPAVRTLKKPIFHFPVSTSISRIGESLYKQVGDTIKAEIEIGVIIIPFFLTIVF